MSIRQSEGSAAGHLELLLYRNRFQLATLDALYSDGDQYIPAIKVLDTLGKDTANIKKVLVLGAGLGSMVQIMQKRGMHPHCTLVDADETVLKWAMEGMDDRNTHAVPVCADARAFMAQNENVYDLIFIDIFLGRVVPGFVTSAPFLQQCYSRLNPGGCLAFNYIINDNQKWLSLRNICKEVLPGFKIADLGANQVITVRKTY